MSDSLRCLVRRPSVSTGRCVLRACACSFRGRLYFASHLTTLPVLAYKFAGDVFSFGGFLLTCSGRVCPLFLLFLCSCERGREGLSGASFFGLLSFPCDGGEVGSGKSCVVAALRGEIAPRVSCLGDVCPGCSRTMRGTGCRHLKLARRGACLCVHKRRLCSLVTRLKRRAYGVLGGGRGEHLSRTNRCSGVTAVCREGSAFGGGLLGTSLCFACPRVGEYIRRVQSV